MSGTIRTYYVSPDFWNDQPEIAAKLIAKKTAEHPDDLWLITIGPRKQTQAWLENMLFMYPPAEDIEEPV